MYRQVSLGLMFILLAVVASTLSGAAPAQEGARVSQPIASVLREPLPPEKLTCVETGEEITVEGPVFSYTVGKASGAIASLRVMRNGEPVIESLGPAEIAVDRRSLASSATPGKFAVVSRGEDKVVLRSEGVLKEADDQGSPLPYTAQTTFFNDGVMVCELKLVPGQDLAVREHIRWQLPVRGRFASYLHKRRNENGPNPASGKLPGAGESIRFANLTSCLQVFSPEAALALFSDSGSTHVSSPDTDTAIIEISSNDAGRPSMTLSQYVVRVKPDAEPYVLKAGEGLTFRVGLSVAPNRLAHRRTHDLRMFTWIGDAKFPYPTDDEIREAARLGYTVFQLHRAGTPGEPRPPAGEFDRVLKTVHDAGMLYVWEENADLLYAIAPGVVDMQAKDQWPLWQGFNYGGRYTASMDPYCDLVATCLASPNGLAEYRLSYLGRMMDNYAVDGIYLDDNLPYANCTLWKEHGHPYPVYDCLIELHEMNWRRRELLRARCPHAVLISHNTTSLVLPAICDFDAHLYGEGYGFGTLETYWDFFGMLKSLDAQNQIWPGGTDKSRCAASVAYNYDLLTGGGQFEYCDWRLYPAKFPYGEGVIPNEALYIQTYNLAQYYFGIYESDPHFFANSADIFTTSAPLTYATIYANRVWQDLLIAVANMGNKTRTTALTIHAPERLGLAPATQYAVYDINARTIAVAEGQAISGSLAQITIPGERLKLFLVRPLPRDSACHLWGGKRISEVIQDGKLVVEIQAPAGLQDVVVLSASGRALEGVTVNGQPAEFFLDPAKNLVHGEVTFTTEPLKLEAVLSPDGRSKLPEKPLPPDRLTVECLAPIPG
jgi:hypothetical protein